MSGPMRGAQPHLYGIAMRPRMAPTPPVAVQARPLTAAEKGELARRLVLAHPEKSNRALGRESGLSYETIRSARLALAAEGLVPSRTIELCRGRVRHG